MGSSLGGSFKFRSNGLYWRAGDGRRSVRGPSPKERSNMSPLAWNCKMGYEMAFIVVRVLP